MTITSWKDPLPAVSWSLPIGKYHPAGFGYSKNYNVHTGIDLYVPEYSSVHAVEGGTVIDIFKFTGMGTSYPNLDTTNAIMIEGASGVVLYGEVEVLKDISIGQLIEPGSKIAVIKCAITNHAMLHLEWYTQGTIQPIIWKQNTAQPKRLLDPTSNLLALKTYRR